MMRKRAGETRHIMNEQSNERFVEVVDVVKDFGAGTIAVDQVSLSVRKGEIFALLGSSGSGKSTLLRMLAGLETASAGKILIDGEDLAAMPPYRRPVNMMFQSYALFPHMSVEGNVAFGLQQENTPKAEMRERVAQVLELVQMGRYAKRKPHQLSGGQQQRVALARSLVKRPQAAVARRTDVGARQADPAAHADRGRQHPPVGRRDVHHGHARPGRGDDHGPTARRDERRPDRPRSARRTKSMNSRIRASRPSSSARQICSRA